MASYQNFLFGETGKEDFVAALRAAVDQYARTQRRPVSAMADNRRVRLQFEPEIYAFYMSLCDEDWVVEESADLARSMPGNEQAAALASKTWRVEFYGDDDEGMEFFNDYFGLLETLSAIPGIVIFDYINQRFFGAT